MRGTESRQLLTPPSALSLPLTRASVTPHRRDKQAAEAQQGGADGAHAERDDDLVRGACVLVLERTADGSWVVTRRLSQFTQLDLDTSEDSHKMDSTAVSVSCPARGAPVWRCPTWPHLCLARVLLSLLGWFPFLPSLFFLRRAERNSSSL